MLHSKYPNPLFPSSEDLRRDLVVRFLAELMQITSVVDNQRDFQAALQTYCDDLRPWLDPSDCPPNPRAVFALLDDFTFDATGEYLTVVLSPEAEAFFRAWLRRCQMWRKAGLSTAHAWSN